MPVDRPTRSGARGATLPGAAAAALTLTATGSVVLPSLPRAATGDVDATGSGSSTTAPTWNASQTHHLSTSVERTYDQAAQRGQLERELQEQRRERRDRVARARQRAELAEKRRTAQAAARRWVLPVTDYRFTSGYGPRWGRLHAGDDYAAPVGTRVGAISSGTVIFAGIQGGYGYKVEIRHWDGTVSWYCHLSRIDVGLGQDVTPGQKIGEVGNSGSSTGPHLHLEVHPDGGEAVDPRAWLAKRGVVVR
ncbi:MAG: M23 family metallopeptidase [Angustibacter sp.]